MTVEDDTATCIRDFIIRTFLFDEAESMPPDSASLLEHRVIDSMAVLELVMFIEQTFDVPVADEDVVPENFDSVDRLAAFARAKQASAAA